MHPPEMGPRGGPYAKRFTFVNDNATSISRAFVLPSWFALTDGTLQCRTNALLLGTDNERPIQLEAGDVWNFDYLPCAETWIANASAGSNAQVNVFGYANKIVPRQVA